SSRVACAERRFRFCAVSGRTHSRSARCGLVHCGGRMRDAICHILAMPSCAAVRGPPASVGPRCPIVVATFGAAYQAIPRYTGSRSRPSMISEYVTSTCSVGSSHVTPRERRKSSKGDVVRSRAWESSCFAVRRPRPHSMVPRHRRPQPRRSPIKMPANVDGSAEDSADHESALTPDLALDPASGWTAAVGGLGILRNEALVPAFLHDGPGREPVIRQATSRVDHPRVGDLALEHGASPMQWQTADVEPVSMQAIERHEDGRRARFVGGAIEQVELAHEVLVEDAHVAVEDQRRCLERGDCGGGFWNNFLTGYAGGKPADPSNIPGPYWTGVLARSI